MLRQDAFVTAGPMLKGSLHCHTTRSADGHVTPEEVMRIHKEYGYDFLAITDHSRYNLKNFLPELGLTIIPGMEYDSNVDLIENSVNYGFRCYDTVCLGPSKEDGNGFEHDLIVARNEAPTPEAFQLGVDEVHAKNNITFICHPQWSSISAKEIAKFRGHFAMEIWNSGGAINNEMDTDAAYWDELLGQGIKLFGVATDDGHEIHHYGHGWVMVNAENNINSILDALKNGRFYSSCGPEIYDFYYEDNKVVVKCSAAAKVRLHGYGHPTRIIRDAAGQMTCAEFDLTKYFPAVYPYVRATVIDADGKYAWTNPIFLK